MRSLVVLLAILPAVLFAQERCGVNAEYFKVHQAESESFESWLVDKKLIKAQENLLSTRQVIEEVYQIPVVFHVIHKGEEIGIGANISTDRILEQLEILNEDFRRQNADSILTPAEFLDAAADSKIEFVLAKRDPEGRPTTGIVRKQGSLNNYRYSETNPSIDQDPILKAESYWPTEDYLNFWITDLTTPQIGYATFPFSNLDGITKISNDPTRDGIVVDFQYIGINENTGGSFASFGRTATHEIGHFLGLKHVNGDGNCSVDDFCEDTPNQSTLYGGDCPSTPQFSCGSSDMYSNYLNYTDDACMNIFTKDQKARMRLVLENSPRRKSLLTSPALKDPIVISEDMGIKHILSPSNDQCSQEIYPTVEVRNYGLDTVDSYTISMFVDNVLTESLNRNVELAPNEVSIVNFSPIITQPELGYHFRFSISTVNGALDVNEENNHASRTIYPTASGTLPYSLDFDIDNVFDSRSELGASSWDVVQAPLTTATNQAVFLDFYNDSTRYGVLEYLTTPVFDLSALNSAELTFEYAYSGKNEEFIKDGLIVAVSTDCGNTFSPQDYLFQRYGENLRTTSPTNNFFVPTSSFDWEEININLTQYTGYDNVQIAFIGHNGLGNALYIDDIVVTSNSLKAYDIGVRSVENVPVVTCDDIIFPVAEIRNYGFETINSFDLTYELVGGNSTTSLIENQILSGEISNLNLEFDNLTPGEYDIQIGISNPNGELDQFEANNISTYHFIVDASEEVLPLRNDFEFENNSQWIITNSTNDPIWSTTKFGFNTVLKADGYNTAEIGKQHWFISPNLNLRDLDSASVEFKYAYGKRSNRKDRLQVLLSTNCGKDFQYVLFDKYSEELSEIVTNNAFIPEDDSVWITNTIDLSEYTVWGDVRIAFVFTNGNGNNLFIDDIEFFTEASPPTLRFEEEFTVYPNPASDYIKLSLNLQEKEDLQISLVHISGKVIYQKEFKNALNQEITLETPTLGGFYFLRLSTPDKTTSKRILIKK